MKFLGFIFLGVGILAGCKPQSLNNEQLEIEKKLVEMSIDTLCHGLEAGDVRTIQRVLSDQFDFTFVGADTFEEAQTPGAFLTLLDTISRSDHAIALGEHRNLSILVSRSGDLATVSYGTLANITVKGTVTTVRFIFSYAMVREHGRWKVLHCLAASPADIFAHDAGSRS